MNNNWKQTVERFYPDKAKQFANSKNNRALGFTVKRV